MESIRIAYCPCSLFRDLESSYQTVMEEDWKGVVQDICLWPSLHADIEELMVEGTYRGVPMGQLVEDPNRTRAGHTQQIRNLQLDREDVLVVSCQHNLRKKNFNKYLIKLIFVSSDGEPETGSSGRVPALGAGGKSFF